MTDDKPETDDRLEAAHEQVTITAPRWVLDTLVAASVTVAAADECPDDYRRDCSSAAKIAQSRLEGDLDETETNRFGVFDCPDCEAPCHESWDECSSCDRPL